MFRVLAFALALSSVAAFAPLHRSRSSSLTTLHESAPEVDRTGRKRVSFREALDNVSKFSRKLNHYDWSDGHNDKVKGFSEEEILALRAKKSDVTPVVDRSGRQRISFKNALNNLVAPPNKPKPYDFSDGHLDKEKVKDSENLLAF